MSTNSDGGLIATPRARVIHYYLQTHIIFKKCLQVLRTYWFEDKY